jgi:tetratricopeptide (TPR) repeat protein
LDERAVVRAFSPGDLLAGRFQIVRFLGAGGMAEVYEAEDQLLDRQHVALKTLPADIAGDTLAGARLQREMALARQVTHRNVCRVFDVDQHVTASGAVVAFFTMELLAGETLATRLQRTGPLSLSEARPLIAQMAAALSTAHTAGIIHGDFKPGNVLLVPSPDGGERLVVTDFGLARRMAIGAASRANTGPLGGTPRYMAPEQLAGRRATRATDVYALAAVVLEMVTGPQADETTATAIQQSDVDPSWPSWRSAILRCLDHNPEKRFQTVDALLGALIAGDSKPTPRWRWVSAVAGLGAAALLVVPPVRGMLHDRWASVFETPQRVVAVLPFTSVDGTPDGEALARGLAAAIGDQLGTVPREKHRLLFVPTADMIDAGESLPLGADRARRAHRIFGADMVVTGRLDATMAPRRITIDLYDASVSPPTPIASRPVEIGDGGRALSRVRTDVALMLGMRPAASMPAFDAGGAGQIEAENLYVRGRGYLERGRSRLDVVPLDAAISTLQQAIALDRGYAQAHAALSEAFLLKYRAAGRAERDTQLLTWAERSAEEACALQPAIAQFHTVRALAYLATGKDNQAIPSLKEALRLDPDEVTARRFLARTDKTQNEATLEEGMRRHPRYWSAHEDLGVLRLNQGRYDQAEALFLAGREYAPDNPRVIGNLAALYTMTEHFDAAEQELKRGLELRPDALLYNNLGWAYFYQEKFSEGLASLQEAVRLRQDDSLMLAGVARGYRWMNRLPESRVAYDKALAVAGKQIGAETANVEVRANLAYMYAETGNPGEAGRQIGIALDADPANTRVRFMSALVYELTGRRQDALEVLKSEIDLRHSMYQFSHHPDLRALRTDDRYVQLIGRMKR